MTTTIPDPRAERGQPMEDDSGRQMAVLGTELRLFKEELSRRFDEHRDEFRGLRSDISTGYVGLPQHGSDIGRLNDRIGNVEADVIDIRTTLATQVATILARIDKRFDDLADTRRWTVGQAVTIGGTFLVAAAGLVTAAIEWVAAH